MKVVVALDKFKGSLTAPQACDIVRRGWLAVHPQAEILLKPMADGGDGTTHALIATRNGEWISLDVTGPLPGQKVTAAYGWFSSDHSAVIEMAAASGLALLKDHERNPLETTTLGTGELIADAIDRGATRIWLAIGGSATVDGGIGAATALGWKFLDVQGHIVPPTGGHLSKITTIQPPSTPLPEVEVLCDVDNPLCGSNGAAHIFGPQKGATPAMVEQLDAGLGHLAALVKSQLEKDVLNIPGAGAAGGLGAGAMAFLNGRLVRGIETVMAAGGLAKALEKADWVITGEGQFDDQSLHGKVVDGVVTLAKKSGAKVAILAGRVRLTEPEWRSAGITTARAITPPGLSTTDAMGQAQELLLTAAQDLARAVQ